MIKTKEEAMELVYEVRAITELIPECPEEEKPAVVRRLKQIKYELEVFKRLNPDA